MAGRHFEYAADKFPEQLEKRNENARILDEYLSNLTLCLL